MSKLLLCEKGAFLKRSSPHSSLFNFPCLDLISGYICLAMSPERLDELDIPLMIINNTENYKTAYTHTVDYRAGLWKLLLYVYYIYIYAERC